MRTLSLLALLFALAVLAQANEPPRDPVAHSLTLRTFDDRLLEIARTYESYGRIDTHWRWSPTFCKAPPPELAKTPPESPRVSMSASTNAATHGRKLYSLFVKIRPKNFPLDGGYIIPGRPNPVGQAVVKEAWSPEIVPDDGRILPGDYVPEGKPKPPKTDFVRYVRKDGRLYHAKEKSALFIMLKLDPKTPDTDDGWVYGTVTPDAKKVTSAGRVASCMKCHDRAGNDRLFGHLDY